MGFNVSSIGAYARTAAVPSTSQTKKTDPTRASAAAAAVTVDISGGIPASPPDEVLDAMGVAAQAHDRLAAQDRGLSFKIDEATGKVMVTVHDSSGKALFTVPASKALDVASGGSLD